MKPSSRNMKKTTPRLIITKFLKTFDFYKQSEKRYLHTKRTKRKHDGRVPVENSANKETVGPNSTKQTGKSLAVWNSTHPGEALSISGGNEEFFAHISSSNLPPPAVRHYEKCFPESLQAEEERMLGRNTQTQTKNAE